MPARKPESIASDLKAPERVMLFCLASGTPWKQVGVTHATPQHLLPKNLIDHDHGARFKLTPLGRDVLAAPPGAIEPTPIAAPWWERYRSISGLRSFIV